MSSRKKIPVRVLQLLYAHSGNQCAFPGCSSPIFEDNGLLTGECCHIKANSIGGPRYDANQLDEERNGVGNLILLCSRHHTIVDNDGSKYSVDVLQEYKKNHENHFRADNLKLSAEQIRYLQQSNSKYWKYIQKIDADTIVPDLKMKVDVNKTLEELIQEYENNVENLCVVIDNIIDSDYRLLESIQEILSKYEIKLDNFNKMLMSVGNSDLHRHNWEMYNLAVPNSINALKMLFLQLVVKLLEEISIRDNEEHPMLCQYRNRLAEHQKHNNYYD